jgi:IclR family pca regulon transcriptional regulator
VATPDSEAFVHSFARGLTVVEAMGRGAPRKTLADIAEATDMSRTAVRRFLMTLIELGFMATDERVYWLTPRVLRLGLTYLSSLPYWRQAGPVLEELGAKVKLSCAMAVLDGEEVIYIQRQHSRRISAVIPSLGTRLPAHAVAMGRVLLASLDDAALDAYLKEATLKRFTPLTVIDRKVLRQRIREVRQTGYAWISGELDEAICGLAVPIRDGDGQTVAAINVSLGNGVMELEGALARLLPDLRQAASKLRATLM